jgi:NADH-quinone oxidoreductase subunit A
MDSWPLAVYFGLVLALLVVMLVLSHLLGERQHDRFKSGIYESGIVPTGPGRPQLSVKYYLVAMFFVIFDLEVAFIFAWAVDARELGWRGYIEVSVFIGVLLAALVYLWRRGALDWSASFWHAHRAGQAARRAARDNGGEPAK